MKTTDKTKTTPFEQMKEDVVIIKQAMQKILGGDGIHPNINAKPVNYCLSSSKPEIVCDNAG